MPHMYMVVEHFSRYLDRATWHLSDIYRFSLLVDHSYSSTLIHFLTITG